MERLSVTSGYWDEPDVNHVKLCRVINHCTFLSLPHVFEVG